MPNTRNVDERIVEMRLDNKGFEEGAHKTISTLEKLEKALHLKGETKAFDDMTESVSKFDANPMISGLEKIKDGFSALEIVGMRVISNLTDSVYNFATKTIKSFTIDPIMQGFGKFGEKTTAVSTLTAQGYELEKVNKLMEDLNWFTDETSYNFTDMVGNIAKFTATGQDLDESVTAMEGIALWAAVSGQNAQKASMAMYQLSQAMGKGALKYDDYKSIQNASMDTQEFRQQAAAAAVELGYLKQAADGVWETTEKTAKANQAFDLAGLFSSDALSRTSWLSSEVMMNVFNRYSRAVAAVKKYLEDHEDTVATASDAMRLMGEEAEAYAKKHAVSLDEAFKRLGYDMDEFSLKALKAGQNARTWGDVVDSVKDAVSTGWMSTFEHLFGDAETATKFWTEIANRFYDIFAEGGNTRNSILELAFGKGSEKLDKTSNSVKNFAGGWERLEKRLESSGKSMADFRKELIKVSSEAELEAIRGFNGIDDALKNGGVSAELFKRAMESLLGVTDEAMSDTDQNVQHATHSLQEMRDVAIGVLRGDFGNGEERRKAIEEMGYDFELIQAMAGQLKWGGLGMSDEKLIEWMELYYQYNHLGQRLGANSFAEYLSTTAEAANEATESIENFNDLYEAVVHGIEEVDTVSGEAMTGGEYFRGAILNIIDSFMAIQKVFREASKEILGTPEQLATGLYKLVRAFYYFTDSMKIGKGTATGLTTIFRILFSVIKGFGVVLKSAGGIAGDVLRAIMAITNVFGEMLGKLSEYDILENFGKAFLTILQAFGPPLNQAAGHIMWIFDRFKEALPGAVEKLGVFLENISKNALGAAESFKEFMASTKVSEAVSTAFGYIYYYLRAIKNGFKDVDLLGNFEKLYNWVKGIFIDINPESSGLLLALEDISDTVEPITRGIMGEPEEAQNRIRTFFETIKNTIVEELSKYTFTDLLNALKVTAMTVFLVKLAGFVEQVKNLTKNISSIPEAIAGTIEKAGDVLVAFRKSVMAEAYIKIAAAIGILAASLWLLSKVPHEDLTHAATVIGVLMLVLAGLVKSMASLGKFGDNNYNIGNKLKINVFNGLAAKLVGLAAVIAAIVAALVVVRKLTGDKPEQLIMTFVGILALIGLLGGIVIAIGKIPKFNGGGAALTFISFAFALQMLMIPLIALAVMPGYVMGKALAALLGLTAIIGIMAAAFSLLGGLEGSGNVMKMAGSMAIFAATIGLLLIPLISLAAMPGYVMGKALAVLLGLSSIIAIMSIAFSAAGGMEGSGNIIKIAAGMALFALAMNLMIPVLGAFGAAILVLEKKFTWEKIKENLLPLAGLAAVLIAFALAGLLLGKALNKLGSGMLKITGSFLLFSVGLFALSYGLEHISEVLPKFIEGLAKAGTSILDPENKKKILWGAAALGILAVAIGVLSVAITKLFKLGNFGVKLSKFSSALGTSIGGIFKDLGKTIIDHMPSMLQLLGSIIVLTALYLLDIVPQMTKIAVQAFVEFFNSLAGAMENNKDQFVDSITSIANTLFGVVKDVLHNIWDERTFGEQLLMLTAIALFAVRRVMVAMVGTSGTGGLLGAFKVLTTGTTAAATGTATATVATMSSLCWWILGIAALIYAVYSGMKQMEQNENTFDEQYFEGHQKDVEGYLHAITKAKEEYEKAYNDWLAEDAAFMEGTSEKSAEEVNAMMLYANTQAAALEKYKARLREYLGLTKKEFDKQLSDAGGNFEEMDAVKKKLEEVKKAAEETGESVNTVATSFEGSFNKEEAFNEVRSNFEALKSDVKTISSEAGNESGDSLIDSLISSLNSDENKNSLFSGGETSVDSLLNGISSESNTLIPYVGDDIVSGFINRMLSEDNSNRLFNAGGGLFDQVYDGVRSRGGIQSPSREMMTLGEYTVDGLVLGILNQSSDLNAAGDTLADNLISTVSEAMSQVAIMADDEFEISPRITPVVDSASLAGYGAKEEYEYWNDISKAQDKIYQSQQDQRQESIRQMGEYRSLWDEYAVRADELGGTVEYSLDNSKMNSLVGDISNKVDALGQQMANMQVVLDSGRLVGGISFTMDQSLGVMSARRGRGN